MEEFENAGILKKEVNPGLDKILNTANRSKAGVSLDKGTMPESGVTLEKTSTPGPGAMSENPTMPLTGAIPGNTTVPQPGAMSENPTVPLQGAMPGNSSPAMNAATRLGNLSGAKTDLEDDELDSDESEYDEEFYPTGTLTDQTSIASPVTPVEADNKKPADKIDAYPGTTPESEKGDETVPYIKCDSLVRIFKSEGIEVMALQGLDLEIQKGELMAIIGKSGSGKSTLLNLLGALDKPSAGYIAYDGVNIAELSSSKLAEFRNKHIGFVWQKNTDNLLNYLTVIENVEMPLLFSKMSRKEKRERARKMLAAVGLAHKEKSFPTMLSGGEQQRVAIATALVNEPELLLMDEPTGAVDKKTSIMLQDLFREINKTIGVTIIIVTHDISLADRVDRVVMISDGKISSERILKEEYKRRIEAGEQMLHDGIEGIDGAGGAQSAEAQSHEEFSILDKAGRVRLSQEMREAVGIDSNRVKIDVKDGQIIITKE